MLHGIATLPASCDGLRSQPKCQGGSACRASICIAPGYGLNSHREGEHAHEACCGGVCRYQTYDELYGYCYKVAGTVALMTTPVMGINPSYKVPLCGFMFPPVELSSTF